MIWHENQSLIDPRVAGGIRMPAVSAPVDPDFSSVVLLLDFAGSDGDTTTIDLSDSAHVATFVADAQVDTAIQALGKNTLLLDGALDQINFPDSADWDFGTGDFTVECHIQTSIDVRTAGLISNYDAPNGWTFRQLSGNNLALLYGDPSIITALWNPDEGTMYHVAVCRDGTDLRLFLDGVQLGTTFTNSTDITGSTSALFVGALGVPTQYFGGNIGAVRITKGVARYTADFTPPTVFYPTQ